LIDLEVFGDLPKELKSGSAGAVERRVKEARKKRGEEE
jgi:hypothetical protein